MAFQETASERVPGLKCGVAGSGNVADEALQKGRVCGPISLWGLSCSLKAATVQQKLTVCLMLASPEADIIHLLGLPCIEPQTGGLKLTEMYLLTVLEAKNLKSKCHQSWFLLEAPRESLPCLSQPLVTILAVHWLWTA